MRTFWLKDPVTKNVWNLTPADPYNETGGCFFNNVKGLGFENAIAQTQVEFDYYTDSVLSKNKPIAGTMYFRSDRHVDSFYEFVRDFGRALEFHYSPDGSIVAEDQLSASWYKPCVIQLIEKNEKNSAAWYEIGITVTPQSDVWRRDVSILSSAPEKTGWSHSFPHFYPYIYGGQAVLAVTIRNSGRTVSPVVEISPTGAAPIQNPRWMREFQYTDIYGQHFSEPQRAQFALSLGAGNTLLVDSRALVNGMSAQRAVVLNPDGKVLENVFNRQEASFDYINFIDLPKGENRIIFFLGTQTDVLIKVRYQEQRELI